MHPAHHRRLGNLPEKEPVWKPDKFTPEQEEVKNKEWLDKKGEEELEDQEDEFSDQRFLEQYRYSHAGFGLVNCSALCR
jgi:hypothetical protein